MNALATVLLGAWLTVWFFWIGTLLGALANVWLHNLTGGAWGEAIRGDLLRLARQLPLVSLLALPLAFGIDALYPWAAHADQGALRWHGMIASPEFKSSWLAPGFFLVRAVVYLLIWNALSLLSQRPAFARSQQFSAFALIVYGFSGGLAAVDWIMSLMPIWYSSVFGWLVDMGQVLAAMAFAIAIIMRRRMPLDAQTCRDLGNLLLTYVLTWAYLAFSQFLIIWAEDLPHEIHWYVVRRTGPWPAVAQLLALGLFFIPVILLLSRRVKQTPALLGGLSVAVLLLQLIDTAWLVLPSIDATSIAWIWALPLAAVIALLMAAPLWRLQRHAGREMHHA
jgi:hypothetical protein